MTVYIRNFRFVKCFGNKIKFDYFTGMKWKSLSCKHRFEGALNVTVYSRFVMDRVTADLCGKEKDVFVRDRILKKYEADLACCVQLNPAEFKEATKLFS